MRTRILWSSDPEASSLGEPPGDGIAPEYYPVLLFLSYVLNEAHEENTIWCGLNSHKEVLGGL